MGEQFHCVELRGAGERFHCVESWGRVSDSIVWNRGGSRVIPMHGIMGVE